MSRTFRCKNIEYRQTNLKFPSASWRRVGTRIGGAYVVVEGNYGELRTYREPTKEELSKRYWNEHNDTSKRNGEWMSKFTRRNLNRRLRHDAELELSLWLKDNTYEVDVRRRALPSWYDLYGF